MNYSTISAKKIQDLSSLSAATKHCLRIGGENARHHMSVDPTLSHLNRHFALDDEMTLVETPDFSLNAAINKMKEHVGAKFRADGHVGTEMVVGASREWMLSRTPEEIEKWVQDNLQAANERFPGQVFGASFHADETNPHMHIYLMPWYQKTIKQRPRKDGRPSRRKPRIGVSHNVVMPHYQKLHDWYNKAMRDAGWSLLRGQPKTITGKTYGELKRRAELVTEEADEKLQHAQRMYTHAGMTQADAHLIADKIHHDAKRQLEIAAHAKEDIVKDWKKMRRGVETFKALNELKDLMKQTLRTLAAFRDVLPAELFSGKPSMVDDLREKLDFIEAMKRDEVTNEINETLKEAKPIYQKHADENEKPQGLSFS